MDLEELKRLNVDALHVLGCAIQGKDFEGKTVTARQVEASAELLKFSKELMIREKKEPPLRGEDFDRIGRVLVEVADLNRGVQLTPGQMGSPALPGPA